MNPAAPWIDYVPSDPKANLRWRLRMAEICQRDPHTRACVKQAAFDDVLFFFQAFLWCYEPRAEVKIVPYCLWPHQNPAVLALDKAITDSASNMEEAIDVVMDKSRAQGGSLMDIGVILKHALAERMFAAGLVSRNMDCVDNSDDPDSLMWKLDWQLSMLPWWMRPEKSTRLLSKHSWTNGNNGSSIVGYAATGDVGSGGRKSVFDFDELAKFDDQRPGAAEDAMVSTQHVANCRIFTSTHKGDSGVYYDMVYGDAWTPVGEIMPMGGSGVYRNSSGGIKIVLAWEDNPTQNRLAYRVVDGECVAERPEEAAAVRKYIAEIRANGNWDKLVRRGFVKEGNLRSLWYDRQCLRKGATPRGIAQELDRDPRGTVGKLFNKEVLDKMRVENVRPPLWQGRPVIHHGVLKLVRQDDGPLKLWFLPGSDSDAPRGQFTVGADIGTGGGEGEKSNSALVGGNCGSGEQILEYADPGISETRFARLAVAVCRWLNEATLIWEAQGPTGKRFANEVMKRLFYTNVWMRETEDVFSLAKTRKPGWNNNRTSDKADLFEDFWIGMDELAFIPRSEDLLTECSGWEWDDKHQNQIIYRGSMHGDLAIAGGLCYKAMKDFIRVGLDRSKQKEVEQAQPGTMAYRMQQRQRVCCNEEDDDLSGFRIGN